MSGGLRRVPPRVRRLVGWRSVARRARANHRAPHAGAYLPQADDPGEFAPRRTGIPRAGSAPNGSEKRCLASSKWMKFWPKFSEKIVVRTKANPSDFQSPQATTRDNCPVSARSRADRALASISGHTYLLWRTGRMARSARLWDAPSSSLVVKWIAEFRRQRERGPNRSMLG